MSKRQKRITLPANLGSTTQAPLCHSRSGGEGQLGLRACEETEGQAGTSRRAARWVTGPGAGEDLHPLADLAIPAQVPPVGAQNEQPPGGGQIRPQGAGARRVVTVPVT